MKKIKMAFAALLIAIAGTVAVPSAASAAVYGPFDRSCVISGKTIKFSIWFDDHSTYGTKITRLKWATNTSYTPSRIAVGYSNYIDSSVFLDFAYGNAANTLHDVPAAYDDVAPSGAGYYYGAKQIEIKTYLNSVGLDCTVYLNV